MEASVNIENAEKSNKISTLIFMDLESTGLPSDVGIKNVHITEMSLIAIDRNSFETDNTLRVLNKISLCVRPRSVISPDSMIITGLYNDNLAKQHVFDDSIPKMLEYFFRRLQKPICLLAHNGNRFDFPVLQAELNRLGFSLGPDIVCADTLVIFRSICHTKKNAEIEKKAIEEEIAKCAQKVDISEEDIDNLLSKDLDSFSQIDTELISEFEKDDSIEVIFPEAKSLESKDILLPTQAEKTPEKNIIPPDYIPKNNVHRKRKILDPTFLPKNLYKKKIVSAKRVLFPGSSKQNLDPEYKSPPPEIHKITKFSLLNLYKFFFNEDPPNNHQAETDCISLCKVCQEVKEDFLQWIDGNSVAFSTISAMW